MRTNVNMPERYHRPSMIDGLVSEIKMRIMSGEYPQGKPLPSQDELSRALGVSRVSLREALYQLSMLGLIEMRHGVGTFVKQANPADFFGHFSSLVVIDRKSADELLQTRCILEPAVTALAAANATEDEIDEIRQSLEVMEKEFKTGYIENYREKDARFHFLVAAGAHNKILFNVNQAIRELLPPTINIAFAASKELLGLAMDYHRRIFDAIVSRESEKASQFAKEHILTVKELHAKIFE